MQMQHPPPLIQQTFIERRQIGVPPGRGDGHVKGLVGPRHLQMVPRGHRRHKLWILVAAKASSSASTFALLAAAPATEAFAPTTSTTSTHLVNGAYWYSYSGYSMGFRLLLNFEESHLS